MNSLFIKSISLIWRIYIFANKLMLRINLFQKLAIALKVLSFKYLPIKRLHITNEHFIFVTTINIDNFRFLTKTINSLKKIHSLRFTFIILDEDWIYDEYFIKEKINNQAEIEIFKSSKEMLVKLNLLMKNQKSNLFFNWINCGDILSSKTFIQLLHSVKNNESTSIFYYDWLLKPKNKDVLSILFFPDFSPDMMYSINYLENSFLHLKNVDFNNLFNSIEKFGRDYIYGMIHFIEKDIVHISEILCIRNHYLISSPPIEILKYFNSNICEINIDKNEVRVILNYETKMSSIIIPSKDNYEILKNCIDSIISKTNHENYEIIILDNSNNYEQKLKYNEFSKNERISIMSPSIDFNYSKYNNIGANIAKGENLIFLNDDVEVACDNWLDEVGQWLDQPNIGILGGCLYYPNTAIQHGGIIVGLVGHAGNLFRKKNDIDNLFPFGSHNWYRNYYAVTGACICIRKDVFNSLGGFDERYKIVYSDVALGITAINAEYRVLYDPFLRLIHHEGKTRNRKTEYQDCSLFEKENKGILRYGDRFYNKNLSYLTFIPRIKLLRELSPLSRIEKLRYFHEK